MSSFIWYISNPRYLNKYNKQYSLYSRKCLKVVCMCVCVYRGAEKMGAEKRGLEVDSFLPYKA